jgi:D-alanine-D-alanine ligase
MGGLSSERDLSIASGDAVHAALVERGHDAVKVWVERDLDVVLRAERIDVAFLALHGRYGEDGCVQGVLELLAIPYTGPGVLASALAADKLKTKEILRLHNLTTPPYYLLRTGQSALAHHGRFGYPALVKPRGEGSSLGVAVARDADELTAAVEGARAFDEDVLVERYVEGREVHVAVLDGEPLGAVEVSGGAPIYSFAARRGARPVALHVPPRLPAERLRGLLRQAAAAVEALEADGLIEVDLMASARGGDFLLEVDGAPALGPHALVPKIAHAAGVDYADLVEAQLAGARLHARGRVGAARSPRRPASASSRSTSAPGAEVH